MTADEKIKEVMELVDAVLDEVAEGWDSREQRSALIAKLRQLIKDDE